MPALPRGRVSTEVVEQVRAATDIAELVGQYVTLKRAGHSFKGLCPFHTEKTPSFMVNPDRQMYYCFGCNKGGDAFSFLMEHDGVGFGEALRVLAGRAGIPVQLESENRGHTEVLFAAAEQAAAFFVAELMSPAGRAARTYLTDRGLSRETAQRFRLGAAPNAFDAVGPALEAAGVAPQSLLQVGLVGRRSQGSGTYDTFRNRLMFPIQSLSGRVIGFGGRLLPGEKKDDRAPKYVNSPDSPIYHKSNVLYGLAESRGAIRRAEAAIITEGYMDYLTLYQAGIQHVVAACGTAFGAKQAALLHRYTHRVYILGDSDPAGRRAAVRTAGLLLEHGFLVHVVELPQGFDPDTFVRQHGAGALETRLREAPGYIAYMKRLVDRRAGDLAIKERVVRRLVDDLGRISDPLLQELYTKELCRSFALTESAVTGALNSRRNTSAGPAAALVPVDAPADATTSPALREARLGLLRLGLTAGAAWKQRVVDELEPEDFAEGCERRVFEALRDAGPDGHWRDYVASKEDDAFASQIEIQGPFSGAPQRLFADFRLYVVEAKLNAASADLERRLREAEVRGDPELVKRLAEQRLALARDKVELRRPPAVG